MTILRSGLIQALLWVALLVAVLCGTVELLMGVGVLALCIAGGIATRSLPLALFGVVGELALIGYGAVEARRRQAALARLQPHQVNSREPSQIHARTNSRLGANAARPTDSADHDHIEGTLGPGTD